MPIYEYRCGGCGFGFERYDAGREAAQREKCPKCGEVSVERVFSTFSSNCCGSGGSAPPSGRCGGGSSQFS